MTDIDPQYLLNQYLYVPMTQGIDTIELGKTLGLYVAREHRAPLTVLCPLKSNAYFHPEFRRLPVVTERSGTITDGGIVLAWCPTHKTMDKAARLTRSGVILVEWSTTSFAGWAKLHNAYNVLSREFMTSPLSAAGEEILGNIVFEGYKGWQDDFALRATRAELENLRDLGELDPDVVLAYVRRARGDSGIDRLRDLLQ